MRVAVVGLIALMIAAPQPTAQDIRARLNTYLTDYEPKLSELIADERLQQRDVPKREGPPGADVFRRRTLLSEVAFIALPGDAGWLGFRRVLKLDDSPVSDQLGSLNSVLASGFQDDYVKAGVMLTDSARFNLGMPRTINLPEVLDNNARYAHHPHGRRLPYGRLVAHRGLTSHRCPAPGRSVGVGQLRNHCRRWL